MDNKLKQAKDREFNRQLLKRWAEITRIRKWKRFVHTKSTKRTWPRMILVKLLAANFKYEIFQNVKKLQDKDIYKQVFIKDDLAEDIARQRQELRCLAAAARYRGFKATVRGGALVVNNKRNSYFKIDEHRGWSCLRKSPCLFVKYV